MLGMLKSLTKATVGVVINTPLAVVGDIVTIGGLVTDEKKPYTQQALEDVAKNLKDAVK